MQHDYDHIAQATDQLASPLRLALLTGIDKAADYFADESWPASRDPHLYSHLVRRHAHDILLTLDLDGWRINKRVPMAGIHIGHPTLLHQIRVLRGGVAEVPPPGHSKRRNEFYGQGVLAFSDPSRGVQPMNLLVLWQQATAGLEIVLVRPTGTWRWGQVAKFDLIRPLVAEVAEPVFDGTDEGDETFGLFVVEDEDASSDE